MLGLLAHNFLHVSRIRVKAFTLRLLMSYIYTVKPVLNGISRDQNIFSLKPGFRLIKVHYIQYKKLNQDMQTLN
jgi:hypothetical protein